MKNQKKDNKDIVGRAAGDGPDAVTVSSSSTTTTTATEVVEAAAVAGAAAGLVVGGPAVSIASAAGVAYLASSSNDDHGALGDVSRHAGETVLDWKQQAQDVWHQNDGQRYVERGVEHAKTFEKDHRLLERLQSLVGATFRTVTDWAREHDVVERTKAVVAKGTTYAVVKIQQCTGRGTAVDQ